MEKLQELYLVQVGNDSGLSTSLTAGGLTELTELTDNGSFTLVSLHKHTSRHAYSHTEIGRDINLNTINNIA